MLNIFNSNEISANVAKFYKTALENQLKMVDAIGGQTDKYLNIVLEQSEMARAEGAKVLKNWADLAKQSQNVYRSMLEDNLSRMSSVIEESS